MSAVATALHPVHPGRPRRAAASIRVASAADLRGVNRVVEAAIETWVLPARVRRLTLPTLRYDAFDLRHMTAVVAEDGSGETIGAALWERAGAPDAPLGCSALLLHGLYVEPRRQRSGVGTALIEHASAVAAGLALDGVALKAWRDSEPFFVRQGFVAMDGDDGALYPRRMWKSA